MDNESTPADLPVAPRSAQAERPPAWADPDMMRLIELVERIGGHGEQPL
jgi:hypothetical protein